MLLFFVLRRSPWIGLLGCWPAAGILKMSQKACLYFPTSLCGVLVLLAAIPPASALPSFPPSSSLPPPLTRSLAHSLTQSLTHAHSLTHSVTHSRSLTHSLTQSLTHSHSQASAETSSLTHSLIHTTQSITDETAEGPAVSRDCRRACGARGAEGAAARVVAAGGPALSAVSGAVFRDCRRGCGARGRRWGPGSLRSVRRSVQRLQKGLRRAWSPLGAPAVLCVTAIVICKAMVVTGCESHCNGCGKDVRTVHYCHCDFHSIGSRRFGITL